MKCPRKFEYKYIYKFKEQPTIRLGVGRTYHNVLETHFKSKLEGNQGLELKDMIAISDSFFGEFLDENKISPSKQTTDEIKVQLDSLLSVFEKSEYSKIEPKIVEDPFEIEIEGIKFTGRIDLLDVNNKLIDFKTASKSYTQDTVDKSIQASAYLYVSKELGVNAQDFQFVINVKNKKPVIQSLITRRTNKQLEFFKSLVYWAGKQIDTGVFVPNTTSYLCGKYCGYNEICMDNTFIPKEGG